VSLYAPKSPIEISKTGNRHKNIAYFTVSKQLELCGGKQERYMFINAYNTLQLKL
jgi:hypothetical protein